MRDRDRFALGEKLGKAALKKRKQVVAARAGAANLGFLVAEGDSWFDYPFYDVLEMLENDGYEVESVAHLGDNLEDMAHDERQIDRLTKAFDKLRQRGIVPKAILLSGGGNDIAGAEFPVLLNHKRSGLSVLNKSVVEGLIGERLRVAMASLIGTVAALSQGCFGARKPVLIHGYSHPVPDGRGYLGGAWILPGPWLEPGFRRKGYFASTAAEEPLVLTRNAAVMRELIDAYNKVLQTVAKSLPDVHYIDVRALLSSEVAGKRYRKDWGNELHPTKPGFRRVADSFAAVLEGV